MIALIISLFLVSLFLVFSGSVALKRFNGRSDLWEFCGVLLFAIGFISFLVSIFMSIEGFVAKKDARFVNKHYGTSYTTEDFFWNGEEIKTMKAFITRYIRKHVRNIRLPDNVHISVARALRGERVGKADPKNERIDALAMRDFRATSTISIETPTHEGHHLTYSDTIAGGDQREEMQLDTDLLRRHIADLPEKQRRVIRMLFGIDSGECATLRDVGDSMGVSYERIRQIKDDAIDTLKKSMSREDWV